MASLSDDLSEAAGITAWHTLFSAAGLKAGETVMIHAGAGGVGSFAVQFAHEATPMPTA